MKQILVFTAKTDIHCDKVAMKLREMNCDIVRINTEDIPNNFQYTINQNCDDTRIDFEILDSSISINAKDIFSIWFRKPEKPILNEDFNSVALKYIETEQARFLQSLYGLLSDKKWVNPFWANKIASQKLPNHTLASKLGLQVPKTLVTNNYNSIQDFLKLCDNQVILKSFNFGGFSMQDNTSWACFAKKVSINDLEKYKSSVKLAPVFLQEYIEKESELRVTIIGKKIFTAKIESQNNKDSIEDFRAVSSYDLVHKEFQLPEKIENKLLAFNEFYNLEFSTFDIIVTPNQEFVFLECNPNGQWLWIEDLTNMPLSLELAKHLSN